MTRNDEASVGLLHDIHMPSMAEKASYQDHKSRTMQVISVVDRYLIPSKTRLKHFLWLCLPSFIAAQFVPTGSVGKKSRPTGYLDGLRGLAAWAVVNDHLMHILSKDGGVAFGHPGPHHAVYKLPIIRLMYNGAFSVSLFFVISGYALSISPVLAMRQTPREPGVAMRKLASSISRRPMRLFLPCWAAMFFVFVLIRLGYFDYFIAREEKFHKYFEGWLKLEGEWASRKPSIWIQLAELIYHDSRLFWVFTSWQIRPWFTNYSLPLWTIPLEFRASLVLFLTHAALFFVRKSMRIAIVTALIVAAVCCQSFDFPLFWIGYLAAELSPLLSDKSSSVNSSIWSTGSSIAALFAGLWVASYPPWGAAETPGFKWTVSLSPWPKEFTGKWWTGLAAALVIPALDRLPLPRRILMSPPIEYLGKLCFSFYLMHFWIVQTIGQAVFHMAWSITGNSNVVTSYLGFCIGYTILMMVIVWVSDIFWRFVEIPSVNLGYAMEKRLMVDS